MRIVIALGGNALRERGENPDAAVQRKHVRRAAQSLGLLAADRRLLVCHGNGPQAGLLVRRSGTDPALSLQCPLGVLGAQTQGMIGYWLVQELANAGVMKPVVALGDPDGGRTRLAAARAVTRADGGHRTGDDPYPGRPRRGRGERRRRRVTGQENSSGPARGSRRGAEEAS